MGIKQMVFLLIIGLAGCSTTPTKQTVRMKLEPHMNELLNQFDKVENDQVGGCKRIIVFIDGEFKNLKLCKNDSQCISDKHCSILNSLNEGKCECWGTGPITACVSAY